MSASSARPESASAGSVLSEAQIRRLCGVDSVVSGPGSVAPGESVICVDDDGVAPCDGCEEVHLKDVLAQVGIDEDDIVALMESGDVSEDALEIIRDTGGKLVNSLPRVASTVENPDGTTATGTAQGGRTLDPAYINLFSQYKEQIEGNEATASNGQCPEVRCEGSANIAKMSDLDTGGTTATGTARTALPVNWWEQLLEGHELAGNERSGSDVGEETAEEDSSPSENEASDDEDIWKIHRRTTMLSLIGIIRAFCPSGRGQWQN